MPKSVLFYLYRASYAFVIEWQIINLLFVLTVFNYAQKPFISCDFDYDSQGKYDK